ncbi:MAG TPA: M28 family peptidase, partial [Thermoanaerobaculia bacterium]|nr:M28 family peptidase [Thermoanaerobaculia bacterium]
DGDAIYNGAVDNASGTAALLEMARALAEAPRRPARTILFASVTGEERGLLGSGYLAYHLPFPLERVVAEVNMDGISTFGRAKDVVAQGAEHSSLGAVAARVAKELDMTISPDPWPDQNFFVRSDQYSFVKRGVPSIWIKLGFTPREQGVDLEAMNKEWRRTRYHAPSDDMSQPLDLEAAADLVAFNLRVVEIVASEKERPRWNAGSFFGVPRD